MVRGWGRRATAVIAGIALVFSVAACSNKGSTPDKNTKACYELDCDAN